MSDHVVVEVDDSATKASTTSLLADILREVVAIREALHSDHKNFKSFNSILRTDYQNGKTVEQLASHYGKTTNEVSNILRLRKPAIKTDGANGAGRWSDEETDQLLLEVKGALSIADIAAKHKRSEQSVRSRLGQYLGWRTRKGDSIDHLSTVIGLDKAEVQKLIDDADRRRVHR